MTKDMTFRKKKGGASGLTWVRCPSNPSSSRRFPPNNWERMTKDVVVSGGVFDTMEGFLGGGALPAQLRPAPALWIPLYLPLTSHRIAILFVFKTKDHDHQDQGPNLTLQIQTGDKVHKYLDTPNNSLHTHTLELCPSHALCPFNFPQSRPRPRA
jgi:hypothetical protein